MAEEKIEPKKLYLIHAPSILEIDEEKYVETSQADSLIERSKTFSVLYFRLASQYEVFADDPVCGAERSAFCSSRIQGPFLSEEKDEQKKKEYLGSYDIWHSTIPVVVPYQEQVLVKKYFRESYLVNIKSDWPYVGAQKNEVRRLKEDIEKALKTLKEGAHRRASKQHITGVLCKDFFSIEWRRIKSKELQGERLVYFLIDSFSDSRGSLRNHFADIIGRISSDYSRNYRIFVSSEEFVSFSTADFSEKYDSVEDIVKANDLIPGSINALGKR